MLLVRTRNVDFVMEKFAVGCGCCRRVASYFVRPYDRNNRRKNSDLVAFAVVNTDVKLELFADATSRDSVPDNTLVYDYSLKNTHGISNCFISTSGLPP